jgi:hypothetical protein
LPRKDRVLPHHHARPAERVDLADLVLGEVRQIVPAERGAVGEQPPQPSDPVEGDGRRRERPPALGRERPVRVEDAAPGGPGLRPPVHKGDEGAEGVLLKDRVGVEDEGVAPARAPERLVVRHGESDVLLVRDQVDVGEPLADHLRRPVGRVVVDDERLDGEAGARPLDRPERLLQELPDVVRHDYDRHVHRSGLGRGAGGRGRRDGHGRAK